jgi:hypothetical protein
LRSVTTRTFSVVGRESILDQPVDAYAGRFQLFAASLGRGVAADQTTSDGCRRARRCYARRLRRRRAE